ncbi:MAG: PAS domain S-box protein [Desulfobulbus sp.]|nr:MAG: PAS domain S-box protein [Desulfobulbus sp.]
MSDQSTIRNLERKISELCRDLQEHKQFAVWFRSIFKALPLGVVFTDHDRRIIMVNPAMEKIFGYTEAELIGRESEILYPSWEEFERMGRVRRGLQTEDNPEPLQVTYRRKNGASFPGEVVGAAMKDDQGRTIGFLGLLQDISARVIRDEKIRQTELLYRAISDFTYDWEYWRHPDGPFLYVSPSCERITGYPPRAFLENPNLVHEIVLPEDREIWERHYRESEAKAAPQEIQFRIVHRDGSVRWIEHACQPAAVEGEKLVGFRASNRDITRRKETEEELRRALVEISGLEKKLEEESAYLREEINLEHNFRNIIGQSNALQYVLFKVEQIAATDTLALILGETGTGKELVARAIHNASRRAKRPLVKVNCAALPANLIESELFGYERGAFTGADKRHAGRFEVADGTTLFLDEIGELPLELQGKLLRVLQEGEFERLGSSRTIKVDVRVIAATNRDLEEDVRLGRFRRDLWFRLNVFPLTVPPLRDRVEDIPLLVDHFVALFARKHGKTVPTVSVAVMTALKRYSWPGNVRELENVIERAVISTTGPRLRLPDGLKINGPEENSHQLKPLSAMERDYILKVLEKTGWKVSGKNSAAEILDIDRSTLRARMKKLGIRKP